MQPSLSPSEGDTTTQSWLLEPLVTLVTLCPITVQAHTCEMSPNLRVRHFVTFTTIFTYQSNIDSLQINRF